MNVVLEFFVVTFRVVWSLVLVAAKWIVKAREKNVAGQVCVITGAGGGLGRIFAKEFARRGATLVLWDVNKRSNEETAGMVREIHNDFISDNVVGDSLGTEREGRLIRPQVHTYVCDVGQRDQVYQTAKQVQHEVGDVDILINNAGVVSGWHLLECPDQLIEHTLTVNCHALFWTSKAFLPRMLELNHGHIVTVASTLGLFSTAGIEDYCASKCGAVGFHESLSHELKALEKDGIKMTLVCPSLVDSDMFRGCPMRGEIAPPVGAEECVRRAMRAILTDEPMIYTPRSMYMVNFMKTVLPFDAMVCMYRFLGADRCMFPFLAHGRQVMNNNESQLVD